ncbi:sensor histidine kinase [Peptococcus simiae]|uniref:sensor histidine kinase n=1 Tax=Peptococcus simiae TaxID=1643805 RepID=UPI00397EAAC1
MELNKNNQSLRYVLTKYLLAISLGLVGAIGFSLLILVFAYKAELIVPANYTENLLMQVKSDIEEMDHFEEAILPKNTSYILLSENGEIINSNMDEPEKVGALAFHKGDGISSANVSFMEIKKDKEYVIIGYAIKPYYKLPWMQHYLPSINILMVSTIILLCMFNTFIITVLWAKRLEKQLMPMFKASEEIAKQNLNFEIERSTIKEFNLVLNSLEKMKVELKKSLEKNWMNEENKRNQISAITHDLKTPLTIIQGNMELLSDTNLTPEQYNYIKFILRNTVRISDYVDTLKLVNHSNDSTSLDFQKISISTLVERMIDLAKEMRIANRVMLPENIKTVDSFILADIKQLERVFINIFTNAKKYSPKGASVELVVAIRDHFLEVTILDQGQGFSNEDLAHATEQFYQGDKSRHSFSGHGLGLYITKQIILKHNGIIKLENRTDRNGAKVILQLPLKEIRKN